MKYLIIVSVVLLVAELASAGGKVVGNGGSNFAFEFAESGRTAIAEIAKNPQAYPEIRISELRRTLDSVKIVVSEDKLFSSVGDTEQISVAVNKHQPDRIILQREAWQLIRDPSIRRALALHELLGLMGIETSGTYTLSRRYLASTGTDCAEKLCELIPHYTCTIKHAEDGKQKAAVVASGITGKTGGNFEYLNLASGKIRAVVFLVSDKKNLFLVDLYDGDVRVNRWRIDDSAFPTQMSSTWQNEQRISGSEWNVSCHL